MKNDERFFSVFEHDEKSVRFCRSVLTGNNAGVALQLMVVLFLAAGLWWLISTPHFLAKSPLELMAIVLWNTILASPLLFLAGLIVWGVFAHETGELDETGFRYEFRVLVPLRRFEVPLEDVLGFEVMPPELSCELDPTCQTLSVRTADGCIVVFQELLSHWLMREKREPTSRFMRPENAESEISTLANTVNRVLTALKPVDLSEVPPEPQPEATRWELDPHEEGSFFSRPGELQAGRITRYFILAAFSGFATAAAVTAWLGIPVVRSEGETLIWGILAILTGTLTCFNLVMILRLVFMPFYRPCFGIDRDALRHGRRALGLFLGRSIPRDECVEMTISECPVPPPATLTQCWRKRMPPHFVLTFHDAGNTPLAQIPGLTRSEARWMRDEILRNS